MKKIILMIICCLFLGLTGCTTINYDDYKGVWTLSGSTSIPNEELIINSIKDGKINFDYLIYRTTTFDGMEAKLDGTTATFDVTNDLGWNIKGSIKLEKDKIVFKIDDSSNENVSNVDYDFTVKSDKSILANGTTEEPDVDLTTYKAVWRNDDSSSPTEEFIINQIDSKKANFDYLVDGIGTFEGMEATVEGQTATFDVTNDLGWNIKGNFKMHDDQVDLTITSSSVEYIEATTITYTLKREKSNLK